MKAVWIMMAVVAGLGSCQSAPRDYCTGPDAEAAAYEASHAFVKRQLKAPATAQFPALDDPEVSVRETGPCRFNILSHVDAQNGYGALIRSRYLAKVLATTDGLHLDEGTIIL